MRRSPLLPIFLIVLVDILGITLMLPLLPFYAERFGASPLVATSLATSYALCQLVSGPLLGRASDSVGRKPLLLVSQAGTFVGFLILASAHSLALVFLSRIIDGATAGNLSLAQAYISDVTAPKDRAKSFAVIGISFGIGFLIGPAISGILSQYGFQYPIYMAAALSFTSIVATTFLLPSAPVRPDTDGGKPIAAAPEPAGPPAVTAARPGDAAPTDGPPPPAGRRLGLLDWGAYVDYFRRPDLGPVLWQFFLFTLGFSLFVSGFALFAERRYTWHGVAFGPKQVGYVFAWAGFLGIILQGGLIGRLVRRYGEARLITAGFLSTTVSMGALGLTRTIPELVGVSTVSSFGNGVLRPSLTSLVTQRVGRHEQGVVLGLTQSLMSVSQIVAPLVAGWLIERGLLTTWALAASAVAAVAVGLSVAVARRTAGAAAQ